MKERGGAMDKLLPWLGLAAAILGWGLSHQIGSDAIFDDCSVGDGPFVLLVCAPALILTIAGGTLSATIWAGGSSENGGRRFVAMLSSLMAALASFAIVLQMIAGLILPSCPG
jgi:hypothetical protein